MVREALVTLDAGEVYDRTSMVMGKLPEADRLWVPERQARLVEIDLGTVDSADGTFVSVAVRINETALWGWPGGSPRSSGSVRIRRRDDRRRGTGGTRG